MAILGEIPNYDKTIFKGNPKGKFRKNGDLYTSSQYRGVSKNGKKF